MVFNSLAASSALQLTTFADVERPSKLVKLLDDYLAAAGSRRRHAATPN
jgi:hypothetical protein